MPGRLPVAGYDRGPSPWGTTGFFACGLRMTAIAIQNDSACGLRMKAPAFGMTAKASQNDIDWAKNPEPWPTMKGPWMALRQMLTSEMARAYNGQLAGRAFRR